MNLGDHLIAVTVGLVLPAVTAIRQLSVRAEIVHVEFETDSKIGIYWSNALTLAVLSGIVLLASSRTPAELGLTVPPEPLGFALGLGVICFALWAVDTWMNVRDERALANTRERWRRLTPFMPEDSREVLHGLVLAVAAAVGEELVFRGFLVGYLLALCGDGTLGVALAVGLPALVFGAVHVYQGYRAALKVALGAALFGWIYVRSGSLWVPIALHLLFDVVAMVGSPWLLGAVPSSRGRRE